MQKFIMFALLTGFCWGCYATPLAKARDQLGPKWPYLGITLGYILFCLAVIIIPMALRGEFTVKGNWLPGLSWGSVAGLLGAGGAYFLTIAMISGGGKVPYIVMAIVFGTAVTVAAVVGIWQTWRENPPTIGLIVSLMCMVVSTIVVAYNTPHAHPKLPPASPATYQPATK